MRGKEFKVDTNTNVASYATNAIEGGGYTATFLEDTYAIEIALELGATYQLTDTVIFTGGYEYIQKNYQFRYLVNEDSSTAMSLSGVVQDNHYFKAGVNILF